MLPAGAAGWGADDLYFTRPRMRHSRWLGQSVSDAPAIEPGHRLVSATSHHFLVAKSLILGGVKYTLRFRTAWSRLEVTTHSAGQRDVSTPLAFGSLAH